jgi:catechol 2,3-dioxygenase-like lactoylglutathione lyase family enzyme
VLIPYSGEVALIKLAGYTLAGALLRRVYDSKFNYLVFGLLRFVAGSIVWIVIGLRMRRLWTIIGVSNVAESCKWYQSLLGLPETAPAHTYFGQILDTDGTVLLSLHQWGAHDHPTLTSPEHAEPGNGLLLFFRLDDFKAALSRARALVDRLEEEPQVNSATGTMEFALRDRDGYYVMISALSPEEEG